MPFVVVILPLVALVGLALGALAAPSVHALTGFGSG